MDAEPDNEPEAESGNGPDADLIMITTGDIRVDLIKDFNNGVSVVVLAKLSCIVLVKHTMDSLGRILTNVINNSFGDLSPLLMALPSFLLLSLLPTPTTSNFSNIPTIFIYYMLIHI